MVAYGYCWCDVVIERRTDGAEGGDWLGRANAEPDGQKTLRGLAGGPMPRGTGRRLRLNVSRIKPSLVIDYTVDG